MHTYIPYLPYIPYIHTIHTYHTYGWEYLYISTHTNTHTHTHIYIYIYIHTRNTNMEKNQKTTESPQMQQIHNGTIESHNSQRHTVHVASNHQTFAALMLCILCGFTTACVWLQEQPPTATSNTPLKQIPTWPTIIMARCICIYIYIYIYIL